MNAATLSHKVLYGLNDARKMLKKAVDLFLIKMIEAVDQL
jgi:hypothetical protein